MVTKTVLHIVNEGGKNKVVFLELHIVSKGKGENNMKKYTAEQMGNAEQLAQILAQIPSGKRQIAVMMTESFLAGMAAQETMSGNKKTA